MKSPGANVTVTTEVGYCPFCQRARNLRREARHLGALVRITVDCDSCHRTLSSTIGPPPAEPEVEKEAAAPETPQPAAEDPKPEAAKPAAKRTAAAKASAPKPKPAATKSAAGKTKSSTAKKK
jgi:hypothetical protein